MNGSDKQVKWATDIIEDFRSEWIDHAAHSIAALSHILSEKRDAMGGLSGEAAARKARAVIRLEKQIAGIDTAGKCYESDDAFKIIENRHLLSNLFTQMETGGLPLAQAQAHAAANIIRGFSS